MSVSLSEHLRRARARRDPVKLAARMRRIGKLGGRVVCIKCLNGTYRRANGICDNCGELYARSLQT